MDMMFLLLMVVALLPLSGIILALTPYLMKKSEVFTVTVPESAVHDEYLKKLKRTYCISVFIGTAVLTALTCALLFTGFDTGAFICMIAGCCVIWGASYALMLYYRKKVNVYKKQQGWKAEHKQSVAVVGEYELPEALSLKWNLLYLPIFVFTALVGYLGYDAMPAQIPMQMSFTGEVSTWMEKSPLVVWVPVLIQIFFAACFLFAHWAIIRSKRPTEPGAPLASAFAYGMFARSQSIYLISGGLVMTVAMIAMPLTFMGALTFMQAALILLLAVVILVVGAIVVSVVYGQGGSRVFRRMQESNVLLADDDSFWKLGIFYYNPSDPNWFLPARFGIGWTCNFARPIVWVFTLGLVLVTVAFVVVLLAII